MSTLEEEFKARTAAYELQRAKFEALRDALGNYGNYRYVNFYDFLDPNNQNWNDYEYKLPGDLFEKKQGRINAGSPEGIFINNIRNAENIGAVYKQSELWDSYDPLSSHDRARKYFRYIFGGKEPDPVQATAGDAQGTQGVQGVQGVQGAKPGNAVAGGGVQGTQTGNTAGGVQGAQAGAQADIGVVKGGVQGSNNGSGGTQGTQGVQAGDTGGTYASSGVPKGGTKTIGYDPYDPNPGNVSLAYAMRNAPEQERRAALIDESNREHGISYVTGKNGVIYRIDPQHPNGYVDPFKNDLSTWTKYTGSTYASPGISNGGMYATGKGMLTSSSDGTYATGEGIKDANGNVLTNPGGDWEYQYALKNPQYGLGMMGKMSDAQKEYLQAVSDDMGYKYNFKGANRFV